MFTPVILNADSRLIRLKDYLDQTASSLGYTSRHCSRATLQPSLSSAAISSSTRLMKRGTARACSPTPMGLLPSISLGRQAVPTNLPEYSDLKTGARFITERFFRVSPRTIEKWPVAIRLINGRRHARTADLFSHAKSLISAAPSIMSNSALHHSRRKLRLVVAEPPKGKGRPAKPPRIDPPKVGQNTREGDAHA